MNVRFCNAYQMRDTFSAFAVLSVALAGLTVAVALLSVWKRAPAVLVANVACNLLTFVSLLILWAMWYGNVWGGTTDLEITGRVPHSAPSQIDPAKR